MVAQVGGRWPQVHLIYFALASIDVAAIAASLIIGFYVMRSFERGVERNVSFDQQSAALANFGAALTEAHASVVNSFVQKRSTIATGNFRAMALDFRREIARFRAKTSATLKGDQQKRFNLQMNKVEQAFSAMERNALNVIASVATGDLEFARTEFGRMQSRYATLQLNIRDIGAKLNLLRKTGNEGDFTAISRFQTLELTLAGALIFIVVGVVAYGHYVGRLMRRKYQEVAEANERLASQNQEIQAHSLDIEKVNGEVAALNRQLEENLVKLRDAQDELLRRGRLSQLGQLTATVAHELRNPLGAVRTSAFLLGRKVKDKNLGVDDQIARINSGISRCDGIITQLLDFARTKTLQRENAVLDDWVARVVEEESQSLPPAVAVECHLGTGGTNVAFDPSQLNRVLINLMSNASEAMVGKGDEVAKAHSGQPRIIISTAFTSRGVEIAVADNGPGIPDSIAEKILEPLFTTKSFGTGLGLPAVVKIMEQHGGGLEVESRPGNGACFVAWWPLASEAREVA